MKMNPVVYFTSVNIYTLSGAGIKFEISFSGDRLT